MSRTRLIHLIVCLTSALALGACTGLQQFPKVSEDYTGDLNKQDLAYETALALINAPGADAKKIRNEEIDRRLRVIDLNFGKFLRGLVTEGVATDLGVALAQLGLGGAGALVSGAASQIISAVSGGLAGAQEAYSKAALYDQTLSALVAQMIASRKAVRVIIITNRAQGIDEYSLSDATGDLDAYEYAGSLPGALKGTAADATVKEDKADDDLAEFRETKFFEDESGNTIRAFIRPPDGKATDPVDAAKLNVPIRLRQVARLLVADR